MSTASPKILVSHTSQDRVWAEWIAWEIEAAGYQAVIQAWDFPPGSNFVLEMQKAAVSCERTIAVLSDAYLAANFTAPEWAAAFTLDPKGEHQKLVPVRVAPCKPEGLLGPIVYVDIVGIDEATARSRLLAGLTQGRAKPAVPPTFPGKATTPETLVYDAKPTFPGISNGPWSVPVGNPFFTGRDGLIASLHDQLKHNRRAILSGLGGIGKTQIVIAYGQHHRDAYTAGFFLRADSEANLIAGLVEIAVLLRLPERDAQDQRDTVSAVQGWLREKVGWLLIVDNADDLPRTRRFLPADSLNGHLLLTTRESATVSFAPPTQVLPMESDVGARLILERAGLLPIGSALNTIPDEHLIVARELNQELGGLPLALEQAAAYIEEMDQTPSEYLAFYKKEENARRLRAWQSSIAMQEHALDGGVGP